MKMRDSWLCFVRSLKRLIHMLVYYVQRSLRQVTITDWVLSNGTVPVMAGGPHVCSVKFKGEVIHKWVDQNFPDQEITYLIGIEANEVKHVLADIDADHRQLGWGL